MNSLQERIARFRARGTGSKPEKGAYRLVMVPKGRGKETVYGPWAERKEVFDQAKKMLKSMPKTPADMSRVRIEKFHKGGNENVPITPSMLSVMGVISSPAELGLDPFDESLDESGSEAAAALFDSLKKGETVLVALKSVMGRGESVSGKFNPWEVGRKSRSKKHGTTTIRLLPLFGRWQGTKFNKHNAYTLTQWPDGGVSAGQGNMGLSLVGIKRPGAGDTFEGLQEARRSKFRLGHARRMKQAYSKQGSFSTRALDPDEYPKRPGMEGPFKYRSGRVLYYDTKAQKYWDPHSDHYVSADEVMKAMESLGEAVESFRSLVEATVTESSKNLIVRIDRRGGLHLQTIPKDKYGQVYSAAFPMDKPKRPAAAAAKIGEKHKAELAQMGLYDAMKFIDAEVAKLGLKSRSGPLRIRWHQYSMPD